MSLVTWGSNTMARLTIAQLTSELEALRHNYELLLTKHQSLQAEYDALPKPAPRGQVLPRVVSNPSRRPVYEFDPSIPGDFKRASELAKANKGTVKRITS